MSVSQQRLWQFFSDTKRNACYIDLYHARTESIDRWINIAFAITSSSSIAGWAIWQHYSFIWAFVIALSQVLQACRGLLPFNKRLKRLGTLGPELNALSLNIEEDWISSSKGYLTEDEMDKCYFRHARKTQDIVNKNFAGESLPPNKKLLAVSDVEADEYMRTYHGSV